MEDSRVVFCVLWRRSSYMHTCWRGAVDSSCQDFDAKPIDIPEPVENREQALLSLTCTRGGIPPAIESNCSSAIWFSGFILMCIDQTLVHNVVLCGVVRTSRLELVHKSGASNGKRLVFFVTAVARPGL